MPAVSEAQRRLFYAALSKQRLGRIGGSSPAAKIARTVPTDTIKEFTVKVPNAPQRKGK